MLISFLVLLENRGRPTLGITSFGTQHFVSDFVFVKNCHNAVFLPPGLREDQHDDGLLLRRGRH